MAIFRFILFSSVYWPPAQKAMLLIVGNQEMYKRMPIQKAKWLRLIIQAGLLIALVYFGLQIILQNSFCEQNLICIALTRRN